MAQDRSTSATALWLRQCLPCGVTRLGTLTAERHGIYAPMSHVTALLDANVYPATWAVKPEVTTPNVGESAPLLLKHLCLRVAALWTAGFPLVTGSIPIEDY
jgi:hypothetical protein